MKKRTFLAISGSAIVAASSASAAGTWVSDGIIAANGQVNDGTNTDRGAFIDLGASFAFPCPLVRPNGSFRGLPQQPVASRRK